ncbi:hypothetical protein PLUA15_220257 [Pseudomonas lundensis]|uniref:Uncharacterized protein n=1 Tax=Pseudomonas lundensis TaxID=86185 RepID=A0AAX2H774_9PSED|nr:hypothetical protein PLUA15_220257 [Pseudomonas lundensis]
MSAKQRRAFVISGLEAFPDPLTLTGLTGFFIYRCYQRAASASITKVFWHNPAPFMTVSENLHDRSIKRIGCLGSCQPLLRPSLCSRV